MTYVEGSHFFSRMDFGGFNGNNPNNNGGGNYGPNSAPASLARFGAPTYGNAGTRASCLLVLL